MRKILKLLVSLVVLALILLAIVKFAPDVAQRANTIEGENCGRGEAQWTSAASGPAAGMRQLKPKPAAIWNERFCPKARFDAPGPNLLTVTFNLATGKSFNSNQLAKTRQGWEDPAVLAPIVDYVMGEMAPHIGLAPMSPTFAIVLQESKLELSRSIAAELAKRTMSEVNLVHGFGLSGNLGLAKAGGIPGASGERANKYCCHSGVSILTNAPGGFSEVWARFYDVAPLTEEVEEPDRGSGHLRVTLGGTIEISTQSIQFVGTHLINNGDKEPPGANGPVRAILGADAFAAAASSDTYVIGADWNEAWSYEGAEGATLANRIAEISTVDVPDNSVPLADGAGEIDYFVSSTDLGSLGSWRGAKMECDETNEKFNPLPWMSDDRNESAYCFDHGMSAATWALG